jgi:hypothetical protein
VAFSAAFLIACSVLNALISSAAFFAAMEDLRGVLRAFFRDVGFDGSASSSASSSTSSSFTARLSDSVFPEPARAVSTFLSLRVRERACDVAVCSIVSIRQTYHVLAIDLNLIHNRRMLGRASEAYALSDSTRFTLSGGTASASRPRTFLALVPPAVEGSLRFGAMVKWRLWVRGDTCWRRNGLVAVTGLVYRNILTKSRMWICEAAILGVAARLRALYGLIQGSGAPASQCPYSSVNPGRGFL